MLAKLKEIQLATLDVLLLFVYTCSAPVGALVILFNDRCERIDFERGQVVGARLAGAFVTKTTTLLGVSRATVSKVIPTYTNHGKITSAKRNIGRKLTLTERDRCTLRRIISKNYRTTAAQVNCSRTEY
jgi:transposase